MMPIRAGNDKSIGGFYREYVTIARQQRGADNWFVRSITDETPRATSLKLNFLKPGKTYVATIYKDGAKAHSIDNLTQFAYTIRYRKIGCKCRHRFTLAACLQRWRSVSIIEN